MRNTHIGILGGGQLGLLLVQAAITFPARVSVYDPNPNCPAAAFAMNFTKGDFADKEAILAFAEDCDVIIFEIEKVNVQALKEIEARGIKVLSSPASLDWIQDKGVQRAKLKESGFRGPNYQYLDADKVAGYDGPFPVVQKWRAGGYDGMGVQIHENIDSIKQAKAIDSIFEEKITIKKEISVVLARKADGEIQIYPPVDMIFDPKLNLIDHLVAPADLNPELIDKLKQLSKEMAEKLNFVGVYAIEFFLDENDQIYVNEVSPRVHNAGHHTVYANATSQYEQAIRIALDLPLGSVETVQKCVMANLLADNATGKTNYVGLEEAYAITNTQFVFYGKDSVRPGRKMGHAVILDDSLDVCLNKLAKVRKTLTITNHE